MSCKVCIFLVIPKMFCYHGLCLQRKHLHGERCDTFSWKRIGYLVMNKHKNPLPGLQTFYWLPLPTGCYSATVCFKRRLHCSAEFIWSGGSPIISPRDQWIMTTETLLLSAIFSGTPPSINLRVPVHLSQFIVYCRTTLSEVFLTHGISTLTWLSEQRNDACQLTPV